MIDYDRLSLIVYGDVDESEHDNFYLDSIIARAEEKDGKIIVTSFAFVFEYDAETYEQIAGRGC